MALRQCHLFHPLSDTMPSFEVIISTLSMMNGVVLGFVFDDLFLEHFHLKNLLLVSTAFATCKPLKKHQRHLLASYISFIKKKNKSEGDLFKYGVVVYPIPPRAHRDLATGFTPFLKTMPEYRDDVEIDKYVQGSFGALGNPSSFHGKYPRRIRDIAKRAFEPYVTEYLIDKYGCLEEEIQHVRDSILMDRLCRREAGNKLTAEMPHRDITEIDLADEDIVLGGWINLNLDGDQYFAGLLGTHLDPKTKDKGFAKLTPEYIKKNDIHGQIKAQRDFKCTKNGLHTNKNGYIVIPPGHGIAFFQNIIHKVVSGSPSKTKDQRMFVGHYVSRSKEPLFKETLEWCTSGMTPKIPSGQWPAMWPGLYQSAWFNRKTGSEKVLNTAKRLRNWGENTFKLICLKKQKTKEGETFYVPGDMKDRILPSLKELGMHDKSEFEYSERDRQVLLPKRVVTQKNLLRILREQTM